jgi:glycosyltransferase involved in cell wall biosynthesis
MNKNSPVLLIDVQSIQTDFSKDRGVGRYTLNIINWLIREHQNKFTLKFLLNSYYDNSTKELYKKIAAKINHEDIHIFYINNYVSWSSDKYSARLKLHEYCRAQLINNINPDILFSPNLQEGLFEPAITSLLDINKNIFTVTTLHDAIPLLYPKKYLTDPDLSVWYNFKIQDAIESDLLITVSESSLKDILETTSISNEKIVSISNGYDENVFYKQKLTNNIQSPPLKHNNFEIIYIGGFDEHKNIERLLASIKILNERFSINCKLRLIGNAFTIHNKILMNSIENNKIENLVILEGRVSDEELREKLITSDAFIFPSIHEGFGLPLIEAMACGIPIICSNISSFHEIINYKPCYFDPYDSNSIANKIHEVLSDENLRTNIIKNSELRLKNYSWRSSTEIITKVILDRYAQSSKKSINSKNVKIIPTSSYLKNANETDLIEYSNLITQNIFTKNIKTIFIDISLINYHKEITGIQRVVISIIGNIPINSEDNTLIKYVKFNSDLKKFTLLKFNQINNSTTFEDLNSIIDFSADDKLIFIDHNMKLIDENFTYLSTLRSQGVKIVHVLYDMIAFTHEKYFWPEICQEFRLWLDNISYSDKIICISQSTANDFNNYLNSKNLTQKPTLEYFHLGSDFNNNPCRIENLSEQEQQIVTFTKSNVSFLVVGTIEPRKGHAEIFSSFEKIWESGVNCNLLFFGKKGWQSDEIINKINATKYKNINFFWLENGNDNFLYHLYSTCKCLIMASNAEGFGLPVVEALHLGCDAICRDLPVFHEIAGDKIIYFNDTDERNNLYTILQSQIKRYQTENINTLRIIENKSLTWKESAKWFHSLI